MLTAFLLSGTATLICEVVWTRALALILGSTCNAVSTILAPFTAGGNLLLQVGGKIEGTGENPADRSRDGG